MFASITLGYRVISVGKNNEEMGRTKGNANSSTLVNLLSHGNNFSISKHHRSGKNSCYELHTRLEINHSFFQIIIDITRLK